MFNTPVLFLIFNRPDTTEKVFQKIREIKPWKLFIAADGPRQGNEKDKINCEAARAISANIDWECEVETLFREENLGCGLAVSQAITWFFSHVEMGIILEDDVLPGNSFFSFCEEMLKYYEDDEEVMHISGGCFLPNSFFKNYSYYFTKYPFCWGWATWKRSWKFFNYEIKLSDFEIEKYGMSKKEQAYWSTIKNQLLNGNIDTWDFRWCFSIWMKRGIVVCSTKNQVKNIGFDCSATHTKSSNIYYDQLEFFETATVVHAGKRGINRKADHLVFNRFYSLKVSIKDKIINKLKKVVNYCNNQI